MQGHTAAYANFINQTVDAYEAIRRFSGKPCTEEEIDSILLKMAGVESYEEFWALDSEPTKLLLRQICGPHGYAVFKAWEIKHGDGRLDCLS